MFFLNYDTKTGEIVSYQGSGETTGRVGDGTHNECPLDTRDNKYDTLVFANDIPGLINENGQLLMKVDVTANPLRVVLKNPVEIPLPIRNPRNAASS